MTKRNQTDLARVMSSIYIPGGHTRVHTDAGERVFVNPNGDIMGEVFTLGTKRANIIEKFNLDEHVARSLECMARCVGRLLVEYECEGKLEYWTGTAFKVGADIVLTAFHVVKENHVVEEKGDKKTYHRKRVFYFPDVSAVIPHDIDLNDLPGVDPLYELKVLSRPSFDAGEILECKLSFEGKKENWETPNDFIFLKIDTRELKTLESFRKIPYLVPRFSELSDECFVVGYPGSIDKEKFLEDYQDSQQPDYQKVANAFGGFQRKVISMGKVENEKTNRGYFAHTAPTLRGTSGGPLVSKISGTSSHAFFDAIHVGGSYKMKNNVAIPTTAKEFWFDYCTAIKGDAAEIQREVKAYISHPAFLDKDCEVSGKGSDDSRKRKHPEN